MPNWTDDDDVTPSDCTRGDWGPNFCTCAWCSAEREKSKARERANQAPTRAIGLDPEAQGSPRFLFLADRHEGVLRRRAAAKGVDELTYLSWIIARHLDT